MQRTNVHPFDCILALQPQVEPGILAAFANCNLTIIGTGSRCTLAPAIAAKLNETGLGLAPVPITFYGGTAPPA